MNTHDRKECRAIEDLLVPLAAGELENELASQLHAHVDDCAGCHKALAEISRAQQLAAVLKLASPELDRYPEFLRRLAASEARSVREAELITEPVESNNQIVALAPIHSEKELAASAAPQAGAAAVIPLFGNRLIFRSGFGRGFDLQIISGNNRELFHLSANSLAKAAAVVAGFGVFAATTLFAIGFVIVLLVQQWQKTGNPNSGQHPVQEERARPEGQLIDQRIHPAQTIPQNFPWLQTVAGDRWALALWKAGSQVQAGFIDRRDNALSLYIQLTPAHSANRPAPEPRISDCSIATDGQNFVAVREYSNNIFAWNLKPSDNKRHTPLHERPIVLSNRGFQPAIVWTGDRYLVVWIEPDPNLPKIKMIELGSDGRPLQPSAMIVAETERENEKLGTPSLVANAGRAMIVYQKQGGVLMARLWSATEGLSGSQVELIRHKGDVVNRVLLAAIGEEYFLCWGENYFEGAELRLAKISLSGKVEKVQTLAVSPMAILTFDFRVTGEGVALIWSEAAVDGAQMFARRFSLEGIPSTRAVNLIPSEVTPLAFAFADAEGKTMIWHEAHTAQMQLPVAIRRIDWNK